MPELTEEERQQLRGSLRTLQIIVAGLILGVVGYTGYCLHLHLVAANPPRRVVIPPGQVSLPQVIAMGAAVVAAVLALLVPPFIPVAGRNKLPLDQLQPKLPNAVIGDWPLESNNPRQAAIQLAAQTIQLRTIVACALLESTAFFNGIYVQNDFSLPNLAMVAVLLILMLSHFPLSGWYFGKIERLMSP